jgi:hypothetical protein
MNVSNLTYVQNPDASPEAEISALAGVYRLCLESCRATKEATRPGGPDDAKEKIKNDSRHQHRNT